MNTTNDDDIELPESTESKSQTGQIDGEKKQRDNFFVLLVLSLVVALVVLLSHLHKASLSNTGSTTSLQALSDGELGDQSEETSPVDRSNKEMSPENEVAPKNNSDDIVKNFEFSALEDAPTEAPTKEKDYFCLHKELARKPLVSIEQACRKISNRLASVSMSTCLAANLIESQCGSNSGFPILYSEFPPIESRKPQGRILVIGGTHGDELTSVSITFRWIEKLNKFHSGLFHWHIAPMMNPDGVLQKEAQRTNSNGIDLNRNLPSIDWQENALKYWREKQNENPRRYPGETPASEPEAQWLIDEINDFKPDAIISVHAPYGVVDFDSLLLNTAPKSLGKLHLNLLGTYPGSLGNYAGIDRGIPVITLELPHAWVMPSQAETSKIWQDIVSWLKKNVGENASSQMSQSNAARR